MTIKSNTRVTVDIPKADHKRLKMIAAHQGVSMREIFITLIERGLEDYEECPYSHEPNAETRKAIDDAKKRKGLTTASTTKELFEKII